MTSELVDREVTRRKFRRETDRWLSDPNRRSRGWTLLDFEENTPSIEIGFLAKLAMSDGSAPIPAMSCAIRLTYENYDLWPPSLTFIDPFSREPVMPAVRAFQRMEGAPPRDVLINGHPHTQLPFLCLPGVREYHDHPQHSGDDWLLHRNRREGSLAVICERIWQLMVRNIVGLNVTLQSLPVWPLQAQLRITLAQGDVETKSKAAPQLQKADPK